MSGWAAFWLCFAVFVLCEWNLYSKGHDTFLWQHRTATEKKFNSAISIANLPPGAAMNEPVTDRELLELAARAAGIGPLDFDYAKRESHGIYFGPRLSMPQGVLMAAMHEYWNPLTDDGDALRLAAGLMIEINWYPASIAKDGTPALCCARSRGIQQVEFYNDDCMAATRRAITRAAAEIGRSLATNPDGEMP